MFRHGRCPPINPCAVSIAGATVFSPGGTGAQGPQGPPGVTAPSFLDFSGTVTGTGDTVLRYFALRPYAHAQGAVVLSNPLAYVSPGVLTATEREPLAYEVNAFTLTVEGVLEGSTASVAGIVVTATLVRVSPGPPYTVTLTPATTSVTFTVNNSDSTIALAPVVITAPQEIIVTPGELVGVRLNVTTPAFGNEDSYLITASATMAVTPL